VPDKALDDALDQKKYTDKQIAYIAGLLEKLGLTLEECYHKGDYDEFGIIYFTQQNGSGRAKMPGWESSGGLRQPTWSFGPPY
jgi:hypothetical protein